MKKIVLIFSLLFSTTTYSMPDYVLTLGQWKSICGTPSQQCNTFIQGLLLSSNFWGDWVLDAFDTSTRDKYLAVTSSLSKNNNGKVCFPNRIDFEKTRSLVNYHLNQQIKKSGRPASDMWRIAHYPTDLVYDVSLYKAFKMAYPCKS